MWNPLKRSYGNNTAVICSGGGKFRGGGMGGGVVGDS
jgi:hypothetical protein